jgi:hypothetical protein
MKPGVSQPVKGRNAHLTSALASWLSDGVGMELWGLGG